MHVLEVWLPLLLLAAIGGTWYHVLRLRERAVAHARRLCEQHGLQFLDDSVALHRLRPQWRDGALRVLREYRFDTSLGDNDRHTASITLLRDRIVATSLPALPQANPPAASTPYMPPSLPPQASESGSVVPFRRRRTLH